MSFMDYVYNGGPEKKRVGTLNKPTWVNLAGETVEASTFPPLEAVRIDGNDDLIAAPLLREKSTGIGESTGLLHQQLNWTNSALQAIDQKLGPDVGGELRDLREIVEGGLRTIGETLEGATISYPSGDPESVAGKAVMETAGAVKNALPSPAFHINREQPSLVKREEGSM